jgi:hypothetical protein
MLIALVIILIMIKRNNVGLCVSVFLSSRHFI